MLLSGCKDAASYGVGRKEYPDYLPAIKFEDSEKLSLAPFKAANPVVFGKVEAVHRQWSGMHAERRKALEIAVETNRTQLIDVGRYTKAEANAAVRAHLQQHGYPPEDPIYEKVK